VAELEEEAASLFQKVSAAEKEVCAAEVRAHALADELEAAQASLFLRSPAIVLRCICIFWIHLPFNEMG